MNGADMNGHSPGFYANGWWNIAEVLTLFADLRQHDESKFLTTITDGPKGVFTTVVKGQQYDPSGALRYTAFFDDELWWVVGLIKVYDVTKNVTSLNIAKASFEKVRRDAKTSPCGGIPNAYAGTDGFVDSSTIATVLYVEAAALLANRVPGQKQYYINLALNQWKWIEKNFLIDGIIAGDQLRDYPKCTNNKEYLTYIEGVAISGLVALQRATGQTKYLDTAELIARTTMSGVHGMVNNGILEEFCDPKGDCDGNLAQFKGILMRGLRQLSVARPGAVNGSIPAFIKKNADSVWTKSRGTDNLLGVRWAGPFLRASDATTRLAAHSSALMGIVQAALY